MSLIDDALKRAQGPQAPPPIQGTSYVPPHSPHTPSKQSPNKFLLGVLALTAIGVVVYYASPTKKAPLPPKEPGKTSSVGRSAAPAHSIPPSPTAKAPKKQGLIEAFTQEPPKIEGKTETSTTLTPPAETPKPEEPALPQLRLDGIVVSATKGKQALINGVPVHVGDTISGATVVEIEKEHVKLNFQTKDIYLSFP